jgi:hypothetical protein
MKKSIGIFTVLLFAAGVLAACNGNNNSTPPGTGSNCGGPPNQLEVLFPAPGSTSAPPQLNNVYVSTNNQLPSSNSFNFFLTQSNGNQTFTSQFFGINPKAIPSPHATPSYPNPVYYASSLPVSYFIGPVQVVTLFWNDGGTGCNPHVPVSSFTTATSR